MQPRSTHDLTLVPLTQVFQALPMPTLSEATLLSLPHGSDQTLSFVRISAHFRDCLKKGAEVRSSGMIPAFPGLRTTLDKFLESKKLTFFDFVAPFFFVLLVLLKQWVVDHVRIVHRAPSYNGYSQ